MIGAILSFLVGLFGLDWYFIIIIGFIGQWDVFRPIPYSKNISSFFYGFILHVGVFSIAYGIGALLA